MKRGTPRHPKTYALAEALAIPLPYAVGLLEMLWHHAAQHTPQGDIGSLPDAAIAQGCAFPRKAQVLIDALVMSGWVDKDTEYRLVIHDWPEHCEQSVVKYLEFHNKDFLDIYRKSLENRKRKSRDSLPSREAKAKAKAKAKELNKEKDAVSAEAQIGGEMRPEFDDQWQEFIRLYKKTGIALIEEDFTAAHFVWAVLDFAQRTMAIANISARIAAGQAAFIPRPEKYLQGEYKRKVIPRSTRGISRSAGAEERRKSQAEREREEFESAYAAWLPNHPGQSQNDFTDWRLEQERAALAKQKKP